MLQKLFSHLCFHISCFWLQSKDLHSSSIKYFINVHLKAFTWFKSCFTYIHSKCNYVNVSKSLFIIMFDCSDHMCELCLDVLLPTCYHLMLSLLSFPYMTLWEGTQTWKSDFRLKNIHIWSSKLNWLDSFNISWVAPSLFQWSNNNHKTADV